MTSLRPSQWESEPVGHVLALFSVAPAEFGSCSARTPRPTTAITGAKAGSSCFRPASLSLSRLVLRRLLVAARALEMENSSFWLQLQSDRRQLIGVRVFFSCLFCSSVFVNDEIMRDRIDECKVQSILADQSMLTMMTNSGSRPLGLLGSS